MRPKAKSGKPPALSLNGLPNCVRNIVQRFPVGLITAGNGVYRFGYLEKRDEADRLRSCFSLLRYANSIERTPKGWVVVLGRKMK